jgi:hypothetical protein
MNAANTAIKRTESQSMLINRRSLIVGAAALIAAPAVVRASSLMPVRTPIVLRRLNTKVGYFFCTAITENWNQTLDVSAVDVASYDARLPVPACRHSHLLEIDDRNTGRMPQIGQDAISSLLIAGDRVPSPLFSVPDDQAHIMLNFTIANRPSLQVGDLIRVEFD